jgi:hypothetical protein
VSGHDDPPDVSDALALVTRHLTPAEATQNRAQRELALARLVQRTSLLVLERMEQVLQRPGRPGGAEFDEDPIGEAVLVANLQRLIRVNPDRKTLAKGSGTHTGPEFNDFNVGPLPTASRRKMAFSGHTAVRLFPTLARSPSFLPGHPATAR